MYVCMYVYILVACMQSKARARMVRGGIPRGRMILAIIPYFNSTARVNVDATREEEDDEDEESMRSLWMLPLHP